jgi:hypothetical protein
MNREELAEFIMRMFAAEVDLPGFTHLVIVPWLTSQLRGIEGEKLGNAVQILTHIGWVTKGDNTLELTPEGNRVAGEFKAEDGHFFLTKIRAFTRNGTVPQST